MRIDVWSDIACPWCYVGKRRLERAVATFSHEVEIVYHSFELDPRAPRVRDDKSYVERLATKYMVPLAQAQQMIDRITRTGAEEGLELRFDRARSGNTFDAHRLLHLARERGVQGALKERLMRAYFTEGVAIGVADELVPLAVEVGLAEPEVREVLASDRYAEDVRRDEERAEELQITGVPFYVMGNRVAVPGAQSSDIMLGALERAWADTAAREAQGPVCGPDGC